MFCKRCGKQIPDNSKVCQYCGVTLVQKTVNNTYNQPQPQPKQPKKTPWKIIVSIVAVVVVLAIIISVVSCVNGNKNEDEKRLLEVLETVTDKPVVEFVHEDYDGDGTTEAYAVVGESEKKEDFTEYYDADIYFVNQTEAEVIKESVSGHSNGTIEVDDIIYVSLEVYDEGTDKGVSFIYTAEENKPVESDISGKYSDVHQDSGKILATDEDGNEIEIEITDSGESDETETTTQPAPEYLEPTEKDWQELDRFFNSTKFSYFSYGGNPGNNFDSTAADAVKRVYSFIYGFGGNSEVYAFIFGGDGKTRDECNHPNNNGEYEHAKSDPLGKFNKMPVYYVYPADRIDWIVKNVFNVTPDRTISTEEYYYYGDYFYIGGGYYGDLTPDYKTEVKTPLGDGKYKAEIYAYYAEENYNFYGTSPMSKTTVTVELKEVDGKRFWSFYTYDIERPNSGN